LFFSFGGSNYLRTAYFPVFASRNMCFDLFYFALSFLAFSALGFTYMLFVSIVLQISGMRPVTSRSSRPV